MSTTTGSASLLTERPMLLATLLGTKDAPCLLATCPMEPTRYGVRSILRSRLQPALGIVVFQTDRSIPTE